MIKIGVSSCFMYPDLERKVFGPKKLLYMGHDMAHYIARRGVMPILIPDLTDEKLFRNFLKQMDGFLFQGGTDIDPKYYGEDPLNEECIGDHARDDYELKVIDYAVKNNKPVLGICRGMQLINVYFGGTLYQDIDLQVTDPSNHRDLILYDELTHSVEFIENSFMGQLHAKCKTKTVNSVHHQAIKDLGENLLVEAVCPHDQLIEGVTWTGPNGGNKPFEDGLVMGIQWHPEFFYSMKSETISPDPIMDHFLYLCGHVKSKNK